MATGRVVAGLDIGTTKITTIIAEVDQGGGVDVIGVGQSPSQGIERGMVMNLEETVQSIMRSVSEAQHMADVKIDSVYTGIAGDHISGINNRAAVTVGRANNEITQEDVARVVAHAKNVDIPPDLQVIHVIPQEFSVDSQKHVREPIGLAGSRLEGEVHIVTGSTTAVQNIRRAVERAGLNVAEIVLQPLASSYAVLMPDEQDHGVVMLDVGGGTTDIAIFYRRCIRHTAVIGLGGTNVTNDISIGLKTPLSEAENLKMQYGCALRDLLPQDREIHPAIGLGGEPAESVSQHHLADVVESRMEEIYEYAWREVGRTEWADMLNSGVVLTGGGSMIKGAVELARRVFGVSVKLGLPTGVGGLVEKVSTPMHATGVGLVLYGAQQGTASPEVIQSYSESESSDSTDRLGGVYRWLREFFTG